MSASVSVEEPPEEPGMIVETYRMLYTELLRRIIWTVSSPLRWVGKR